MERLTLKSNSLLVEVLPEYGAKICSLRTLPERQELLQAPLLPYAPRTRTMAFADGDASGIDDCVPTVSGCETHGGQGDLVIPDHGDFWRIPFSYRQDEHELALQAEGFSLPLRFGKTLRLRGNVLSLDYRLQNIGSATVPYLWSAHPGFAVEAGDRIVLPPSVGEVTVWYSGGARLGEPGRVHPWPLTRNRASEAVDLSLVGPAESRVGDKLFAVAPSEGWVAVDRNRLGRRIEIRFDPAHSTYVGLWLAYGGWPDGHIARQYCVALEPCTAPVDSLAVAVERGVARSLAAGAAIEWSIEIHVVPA